MIFTQVFFVLILGSVSGSHSGTRSDLLDHLGRADHRQAKASVVGNFSRRLPQWFLQRPHHQAGPDLPYHNPQA